MPLATSPPRREVRNCSVAGRSNGAISWWATKPSFHSACTASGAGAPDRIVATMRTTSVLTRPSNVAAEWSSRRWASSTTNSGGPAPPSSCWCRRIAFSTSAGWSGMMFSGRTGASVPNEIERLASVATSRSTRPPAASTWRATVAARAVLPTPAAPDSSAPRPPVTAVRSSASSRSRAISCLPTSCLRPGDAYRQRRYHPALRSPAAGIRTDHGWRRRTESGSWRTLRRCSFGSDVPPKGLP